MKKKIPLRRFKPQTSNNSSSSSVLARLISRAPDSGMVVSKIRDIYPRPTSTLDYLTKLTQLSHPQPSLNPMETEHSSTGMEIYTNANPSCSPPQNVNAYGMTFINEPDRGIYNSPYDYMEEDRPSPLSVEQEIASQRDWTGEFQSLLSQQKSSTVVALAQLYKDFLSIVTQVGKLIIRERHLPIDQRSFKPVEGQGFAGGEKYIVNNLFFKYAVDTSKIYDGIKNAMKVAGHELKGLTAYISTGVSGLNYPLMALIDYWGYRLIASSRLPIDSETLVYGSSDGGTTVHTVLDDMNILMENAAKILNIKGHVAGIGDPSNRAYVYGPADLEGHLGNDGNFYVLDFARTFPPEFMPYRPQDSSFLYKLLRPEFVSRYPIPLSSDAFSLFGEDEHAYHNFEVKEATRVLHNTVIPLFAQFLDHTETEYRDFHRLIEELHRSGINIRHLGLVRSMVSSEKIRTLILTELIARVLKNELRSRMRSLSSSFEKDVKRVVFDLFFEVFVSESNDQLWNKRIKLDLRTDFIDSLSEEEVGLSFDLKQYLEGETGLLLFQRVQFLTGVSFSKFHFLELTHPSDIKKLRVKTKKFYTIPRIQADDFLSRANREIEAEKKVQLYKEAENIYTEILHLKPDDFSALFSLAIVKANIASLASDQDHKKRLELYQQAYDKFRSSLVCFNKYFIHGSAMNRNPSFFRQTFPDPLFGSLLNSTPSETTLSGQEISETSEEMGNPNIVPTNKEWKTLHKRIIGSWCNTLRLHASQIMKQTHVNEEERELEEHCLAYACTIYHEAIKLMPQESFEM